MVAFMSPPSHSHFPPTPHVLWHFLTTITGDTLFCSIHPSAPLTFAWKKSVRKISYKEECACQKQVLRVRACRCSTSQPYTHPPLSFLALSLVPPPFRLFLLLLPLACSIVSSLFSFLFTNWRTDLPSTRSMSRDSLLPPPQKIDAQSEREHIAFTLSIRGPLAYNTSPSPLPSFWTTPCPLPNAPCHPLNFDFREKDLAHCHASHIRSYHLPSPTILTRLIVATSRLSFQGIGLLLFCFNWQSRVRGGLFLLTAF